MKLSRVLLSLRSASRPTLIFESGVKVPSARTPNEPFTSVTSRTASLGAANPASCSRTRTIAFEPDCTWNTRAPGSGVGAVVGEAVAGAGVGVGVGVGVGDGAAAGEAHANATHARRANARRRAIKATSGTYPYYVRGRGADACDPTASGTRGTSRSAARPRPAAPS